MSIRTLLAALSLLLAATTAPALTLDFGSDGNPLGCSDAADGLGASVACGNYSYLAQSWGDVAGVADITYSAPRLGTSMQWWAGDYNTLYGVAWAGGGDGDSLARIEIRAVQPGETVSLSGFDLGAYPNTTRGTTVNVYAIGGGTPLFSFVGDVGGPANAPTHFAPAVSAVGGLWIEWADSAFNVGIDNISYSVSAVPEPSVALLTLAGVALLLARRRRG